MLYTRSFYGLTHCSTACRYRTATAAGDRGVPDRRASAWRCISVSGQDPDVLSVLSFGYGILQKAFTNPAGMAVVLLAVSLGKILTTGLTIGSGGSGGVFGPSMVIGGCAGGALGLGCTALWPPLAPQPAAFVIVGMAGFFAAAAKTPFSTLVIVSEMTGDYNLLLPTLFVCTLVVPALRRAVDLQSQVESRSRSPAHQGSYVRDVLDRGAGQPIPQAYGWTGPKLRPGDPLDHGRRAFPGSGDPGPAGGRRRGPAARRDQSGRGERGPAIVGRGSLLVAADMTRGGITPLDADDDLDRALELFVENDLLALPVVDGDRHVIGMVRRFDVVGEYLKRVHAPPPGG